MGADVTALPPGFVLDPLPAASAVPALPPGFTMDAPPSTAEAAAQGAAQGLTLGWSDEMQGALDAGGRGAREPASLGHLVMGLYRLANGDPAAQARYAASRDANRAQVEADRAAHPGAYLAGNVGGALATAPLLPMGGAATTASNIARGAGAGAAYGAVQGSGDAKEMADIPHDAMTGAIAGGAVGAAIPAVISGVQRAITPLPISAERNALANTLRNEGVDLTAGQVTGSKPLRWAESALGDMPGGGGAAMRAAENQGEQFTSAILRRVGSNEARATPEAIDNAFATIGQQFDDLATRNTMGFDHRLARDLGGVVRDYSSLVAPSMRAPVVRNVIQDLLDAGATTGNLPGPVYASMRSRLDRLARGAKADPQLSDALFGIRNALDDAMERSISQADQVAWREARRQYRNMLVVEKAATGAGENAAQGLISPSALRNAVVNQNRRAYARGQGDFADLARAGEAIMKPLPQSGTAPRQNIQNLMTALGAVAGGASGGIPGALFGAIAPGVASRALNSGVVQRYLTNQLAAGPLAPGAQGLLASLLGAPSRQLAVDYQVGPSAGR